MAKVKKKVRVHYHPIVKEFTEEQKALFREVRSLYHSHNMDQAEKRYQIGRTVNAARADHAKYGDRTVERIALALSIPLSTLWRWMNVAECYTKETFCKLMNRRTKHGNRITWTHLWLLSTVRPASARQRLCDAVYKEDLNSSELAERIKELEDYMPSAPKGPMKPRSVKSGLNTMTKTVDKFVEFCGVFDESVTDKIEAQDPRKVEPDVLDRLRTSKESLESLIEVASEKLSSVCECIRKLEEAANDPEVLKAAAREKSAAAAMERRAAIRGRKAVINDPAAEPSSNAL